MLSLHSIGVSMMGNTLEKLKWKIGYKGCRNCTHQIDVLRMCKWAEHGGDGVLHLICPKWEKKDE